MSRRVYQKRLPPKELVIEDEIKREVEAKESTVPVFKFKTMAEQIAKSSIFHKNWYVPELREKFRYIDRMKRIDKVFPYAKLSEGKETMLLVDEPLNPQESEICAQKAKHLKELGYAYVYLEKDTTLYDALNMLGEI
jgi:hypothetical protein